MLHLFDFWTPVGCSHYSCIRLDFLIEIDALLLQKYSWKTCFNYRNEGSNISIKSLFITICPSLCILVQNFLNNPSACLNAGRQRRILDVSLLLPLKTQMTITITYKGTTWCGYVIYIPYHSHTVNKSIYYRFTKM